MTASSHTSWRRLSPPSNMANGSRVDNVVRGLSLATGRSGLPSYYSDYSLNCETWTVAVVPGVVAVLAGRAPEARRTRRPRTAIRLILFPGGVAVTRTRRARTLIFLLLVVVVVLVAPDSRAAAVGLPVARQQTLRHRRRIVEPEHLSPFSVHSRQQLLPSSQENLQSSPNRLANCVL